MEYTETFISHLGADLASAANTSSSPSPYDIGLQRFASVEEMVKTLRPAQSILCMHPERLAEAAQTFVKHFPGHSLYAVKSNPDPYVLRHLYAAGIRHFDVASLGEVKQISELFPDAHMAFMNPVKAREAIRSAYFDYGVRDYVIDTFEEMHKILEETNAATDLTIVVRVAMPKGSAACALTGKFGCTPEVGAQLLRDADKVAKKVGISFHVGSQSTDPSSYASAIQKAGEIMRAAGVELDVLDVGGGFPVPGLGMDVPPLTDYFAVIKQELDKLNLPSTCEVWSEPGRALCGTGATLVVRVELRKGDVLYINDGSYGNMFEVCAMSWKNRAQVIRLPRRGRKANSKNQTPYRFYGPTCDSVDHMQGPFMLSEDIGEGDFIAIDSMGAYTNASRSHFNGFYSDYQVEITEQAPAAKRQRKASSSHLKLVKP